MRADDPQGNFPWLREKLIASWWEIAAVLLFTIGYFTFSAAWIAHSRWLGHYINFRPSNYRLIHLAAVESVILALWFCFLRWRGWTPSDFQIRIGWWSSLQGLFLLAAWTVSVFGLYYVLFLSRKYHYSLGFYSVTGPIPKYHPIVLSWTALIVAQTVNAYYEELTFMAYAFNQFASKRGPLFALAATTFLRLLIHTWKQPVSMIETGVAFLIFGVFYWRVRKLWPLILAHAVFDIILGAMMASKRSF
jgi:uncharacterized protein